MPWSRPALAGAAALVAVLGALAPMDVGAQALPLRPRPAGGFPLVPIMEGWWDNGDGTFTISFGYTNRNPEPMEIPIGPENTLDPASFNGMQPTWFENGRHRGIFTVTLPANLARSDVWWRITSNGEQTAVPGRTRSTVYQLDYNPRPHGTVAPRLWFEEGGEIGQWPPGFVWDRVQTVRAGELLTLTVHTDDPSVRDPADRRFREPLDVAVTFFKHQGPPGAIEWVAHPDNPSAPPPPEAAGRGAGAGAADPAGAPAAAAGGAAGRGGRGGAAAAPPADQQNVEGGRGTVMVQARFPAPGDWMIRVQADQFSSAPDSGSGDQCCWTNAYVRVRVTP